jgi:hypothetical protein
MKLKARQLLEMPMDLGDTPDFIEPGRKRQLARGEHPLGKNPATPATPPESTSNYHELVASGVYKEVINKIQRYTGIRPRNTRDVMGLVTMMFDAVKKIGEIERGHEAELEALAVQVVLALPEFKSLKGPVERGELILQPHLTSEIDLAGVKMSADQIEPDGAEEIAQVAAELDLEVQKRKFVNALIQGSAVSKNYAFHLVDDRLAEIDPTLANLYGTVMSLSEFGYWVMPDSTVRLAVNGDEAKAGEARITQNEDGVPVIVAKGKTFPFLVQELVKGVMEYLSFDDENDPGVRKEVYDKSDFVDEETWSMMLGPGIWKQFLTAIGHDSHEVMPHVYDEIMRMPASQFNSMMKSILAGAPEGKQALRGLAAKVKRDLESGGQQESVPQQIADRMLED